MGRESRDRGVGMSIARVSGKCAFCRRLILVGSPYRGSDNARFHESCYQVGLDPAAINVRGRQEPKRAGADGEII